VACTDDWAIRQNPARPSEQLESRVVIVSADARENDVPWPIGFGLLNELVIVDGHKTTGLFGIQIQRD
jgi:hypothetical protein